MELEMTESEICHRFKRNGCGKRMIPILAQLNAVDDEILWRNDLLKEKPRFMHKYQYCQEENDGEISVQAGGASLTPLQIQGDARKGDKDA